MKQRLWIILGAVFAVSFGWLLPGAAPTITAGDAAELISGAQVLGIAHPPGYPAFVNFYNAFLNFIPFGTDAYAQNVISTLLVSLNLMLLGLILFRLTKLIYMAALPLLLCFSGAVKTMSATAEVFPLTLAFSSFVFLLVLTVQDQQRRIVLLGFLIGMALAVHQTLIFAVPGWLFLALSDSKKKVDTRTWLYSAAFLAVGFSINLYLPIRSLQQPLLNWESPHTLARFWGVLTRARYGTLQLAQGATPFSFSFGSLFGGLELMGKTVVTFIGWVGLGLSVLAIWMAVFHRWNRRVVFSIVIFSLITGPLLFWWARVPYSSTVIDRFTWLPGSISLLLAGLGLLSLIKSEHVLYQKMAWIFLGFMVIELMARNPLEARPSYEMREEFSIRDHILNVLHHAPVGTTLLSDRADETEFGMLYADCAGWPRRDVQFIDCNAAVTKNIYGDDYHRIWGEPRLRRREIVENELIEKSTSTVLYATSEPAMLAIARDPFGFLYLAKAASGSQPRPLPPEILFYRGSPAEPRAQGVLHQDFTTYAGWALDSGDAKTAEKMLGIVQSMGGSHRLEHLGYLHHRAGREQLAQKVYMEAFSRGATGESLFSNLGALYLKNGQFNQALMLYKRGLELYPQSWSLYFNRSAVYWKQENWPAVISDLTRVLTLAPGHADAKRLLPIAKSRAQQGAS